MPENPYEPPKTLESVTQERAELFDRIGGYLRWGFRIGLLLIILSAFVHMRSDGPLDTVSISGSILVVLSLIGIIPLSIWGFIKGFREGRKNSASSNHTNLTT